MVKIRYQPLYPPGLDYKVFTSSCLPKKFKDDWTFGGITYKVSGIPDGKSLTSKLLSTPPTPHQFPRQNKIINVNPSLRNDNIIIKFQKCS